jgi:transposase
LKERLARLEAKLGEPPKTPSNSSLPPSQGRKASGEASSMQNGKPHKGTNRELRPNPTSTLDVRAKECSSCGGDVSGWSRARSNATTASSCPRSSQM